LTFLGRQAEIDILINRATLAEAGMSDRSEISFDADNRRLIDALNDLLIPLKLDFRVIDAKTVQVAAASAINERMEIEFYPVDKILGENIKGEELIKRIESEVEPLSWTDIESSAAILFDRTSGYLIVRQSQRVQRAIEAFLSTFNGAAK
jgi:hypothetical protein